MAFVCSGGGHVRPGVRCCSRSLTPPYLSSHRCPSTHVGTYCQYENPCLTGRGQRCQNGGTCKVELTYSSSPQFSCKCPIGYSASLCEIPVANACDSEPCQNGGTCSLERLDLYHCNCPTRFRGDNCELIDHCASKPCRNEAQCESLESSYRCKCADGFTGANCTRDINECDKAPCAHGRCVNTFGGYQ